MPGESWAEERLLELARGSEEATLALSLRDGQRFLETASAEELRDARDEALGHGWRTLRGGVLGAQGRLGVGAGSLGWAVPGAHPPARMRSKSWKAVLKRVLARRTSWASRARKAKELRKDRRPAPTAKLQAELLLLRTQCSCELSVLFW